MTNPVYEGDIFDEEAPDPGEDEFLGEALHLDPDDFLGSLMKAAAHHQVADTIRRAAELGVTLTEDEVLDLSQDEFLSLLGDLDDPEGHRHYYNWAGDQWVDDGGTPMEGGPYAVSNVLAARLKTTTLELAATIDFLQNNDGIVLHPKHAAEVVFMLEQLQDHIGGLAVYPTNPIHTESESDLVSKMRVSFEDGKAKEFETWLYDHIDAEVARRRGSVSRILELFGEGKGPDEVSEIVDAEFPPVRLGEPPA